MKRRTITTVRNNCENESSDGGGGGDNGNYHYYTMSFTMSFTILTPATRELERIAVIRSKLVNNSTLVLLIATTLRTKVGLQETSFDGVVLTFRVIPTPETKMR